MHPIVDGCPRVDDHPKPTVQEQEILPDLHRAGDFRTKEF
jgi:hypothetical protein